MTDSFVGDYVCFGARSIGLLAIFVLFLTMTIVDIRLFLHV
jgi:hypothetical protein